MQMDLMFFFPEIKGKTGVLNAIDVHSRKAFSELINNKKEATSSSSSDGSSSESRAKTTIV